MKNSKSKHPKAMIKKYARKLSMVVFILCIKLHLLGQPIIKDTMEYISIEGAKMFIRVVGTGEPLVIIHGGPGMSHDYLATPLINLLAKDHQLIFYDQRASGRSSGIDDTSRLTMSQFVNDLETLRQQLKINKLNVLGHSFGGLLAMYYATSHPDHVNRLLLIDTSPASWELNFPYFRKTIAERQTDADRQSLQAIRSEKNYSSNPMSMDRYFKINFKPFFKDTSLIAKLELGIDKSWLSNFNITNDAVWKSIGHYDIHNQLKSIRATTLILHGDYSVISMDGAKEIAKFIPRAQFVAMKDVGHFPFLEDPQSFNRIVREFLGEN